MAFKVGSQILPGYPMPVGEKYLVVLDRTGPASYTQFNTATGAGGDVLSAQGGPLNFGGFDYMDADASDTTGQIQVFPVYTKGGSGNAVPQVTLKYVSLVTATVGGQAQTAGAEVAAATNLSTLSFRLRALMV
jgi:hypothetical protein